MSIDLFIEKCAKSGIKFNIQDSELKVFSKNSIPNEILDEIREKRKSIEEWLISFELIERSLLTNTYTPSDFPNATILSDQKVLDALQAEHPNLSKLYVSTPMQQGMVFHGLLDENAGSYTTQVFADFVGALNVSAFKRAWDYVVDRHDIFRTCFIGLDSEDMHQLVLDRVDIPFFEEDWRHVSIAEHDAQFKQYIEKDRAIGFDFGQAPLMRMSLIRLSDDRYHFLWSHHHVLLDGWGLPLVFSDFFSAYHAYCRDGSPLLSDVIPYENYITWLRSQDQGDASRFWSSHLSDIEAPTPLVIDKLPIDPAVMGSQELQFTLSTSLSRKLEEQARIARSTMNVLVQAAWAYVLHRYSGANDVVFGSTISGRPADLPGVETMVGLFINSVPVKASFVEGLQLGDFLQSLHRDNIDREGYGYLSLAEIQKLSGVPSGSALFDSLVVFENYPVDTTLASSASDEVNGVSLESFGSHERTNYNLTIVAHHQESLHCIFKYQASVFAPATIERLKSHLENVLTGIAEASLSDQVQSLPLLSSLERDRLLIEWNDTSAAYASDKCLHTLFEEQASRTPDNIAVVYEGSELSYAELNKRSNQLAHYLIEQGVKPDSLVGLCLDRSLEMVVGIMGILKAGGAYVPLDPDYPEDRLRFMLDDTQAHIVIGQASIATDLSLFDERCQDRPELVLLDEPEQLEALSFYPETNPDTSALGICSDHLAYVIYTSGSTGKPKGVCVEHKSVG
uniref:condensation domain-containing protein n=1 Tax=Kordiimonas aquimaris TaxID=707591 RepID=UPI0021D0C24A